MKLVAFFFCGLLLAQDVAPPVRKPRVHRSEAARRHFKQENPCPSTGESTGRCPGYVIDHIVPLACGGEDAPDNMQWQTIEEGKAKDKIERRECGGQ
jgi:5-methylcytosine-specific restriction endonuclease McrA